MVHGLAHGPQVAPWRRTGMRSRLDAVVRRVSKAAPSLKCKKIGPHTLRHSTAMAMLAAGVDLSTIAMWLGHESVQTIQRYMVADMEMKEKNLEKALGKNPFGEAPQQTLYEPDEGLLPSWNRFKRKRYVPGPPTKSQMEAHVLRCPAPSCGLSRTA